MKKIILNIGLIMLVIQASSQITPIDSTQTREINKQSLKEVVEAQMVEKKAALIKNSYSPFKAKLSSVLSNVSLSSTFDQGNKAEASLNYAANQDSNLIMGIFISQPIGKDDKKATPFSFTDGLASGSTFGFNINYIRFISRKFKTKPLKDIDFDEFIKAKSSYAKTQKKDERTITYNEVKNNGTDEEKAMLPRLTTPIFFNLKASLSKTSFSFATDSITLKKNDINYLTPNISFSVGIQSSKSSYIAVGYSYAKTYTAADDVTFNMPFGTTNNQFTQTIAFGGPTQKIDNKISLQFSKMFGESSSVGILPTITYGFDSKNAAITLPIYFIKGMADGKPNGLQGGMQFGYATSTKNGAWSSFKDGFGAQLILGLPFDVFASRPKNN